MGCLSSTFKYILYAINLIFVIIGVLLIIFGSLMVASMQNATDFEGSTKSLAFPVSVLVIGCITFLVAFFGCCGTIKENACLTTTYSVCMLVLFCLQISLSIWLFVESDVFLGLMSDIVDASWTDNNAEHNYPMDNLQLTFNCCGIVGYQDYGTEVPASCCGYSDRSKRCDVSIYSLRPGCKTEFVDFWSSNMVVIRWSSIVIALVELVISAVSCRLANKMSRY
ncbi:23 kDa integral membrane protein-like [Drosophila serrata]|uniref:23 kDa integral membrane protein-like n=1 Tax=Drosophila serrata TaxID=7274 RepID=UPI000A1CF501|nr:23 kDa integral membrane protein-like [Drosophila serrata]